MRVHQDEFLRGIVRLRVDYKGTQAAIEFQRSDIGVTDKSDSGLARDEALMLLREFASAIVEDVDARRVSWAAI